MSKEGQSIFSPKTVFSLAVSTAVAAVGFQEWNTYTITSETVHRILAEGENLALYGRCSAPPRGQDNADKQIDLAGTKAGYISSRYYLVDRQDRRVLTVLARAEAAQLQAKADERAYALRSWARAGVVERKFPGVYIVKADSGVDIATRSGLFPNGIVPKEMSKKQMEAVEPVTSESLRASLYCPGRALTDAKEMLEEVLNPNIPKIGLRQ